MLSRALILAAVTLLIGDLAAAPAHAQATNLEAGKTPAQIFAGTCTACHKSPRGLLRTVPAGSLTGFLRQHYTTSPDMAGLLSSYLVSNGAADTRYQTKPDKDAKSDGKPGAPVEQLDRHGHRLHTAAPSPEPAKPESARPEPAKPEAEPRQAAKPEADGVQGDPKGRRGKRLARPEEVAKPAEGEAAAREAGERGPDGRKLTAKQRLRKRGKPGVEEPIKGDAGKDMAKDTAKDTSKPDIGKDEPAAAASAKEDKPAAEAVKEEAAKPEGAKPSGEAKSDAAKSETVKPETPKSDTAKSDTAKSDTAKTDTEKTDAPATNEPGGQAPALRADPVPSVTPPARAASPANSTAVSGATPEPKAGSSTPAARPSAAPQPASPAVTASSPVPAPVAPAGPPVPPISQ